MFKKNIYIYIVIILLLSMTALVKSKKLNHHSLLIETCEPLNLDSLITAFHIQYPDSLFCSNQQLSYKTKGMVRRINIPDSSEKTIFLTFDACGQGGFSDGFDSLLVDFLINNDIPVSFFISRRWSLKNPENLNYIIKKGKNIEILNHGTQHIPLSSKGDSLYGIIGTNGLKEIYNEVEISACFFCEKIGNKPKFFRPGTAYGDEIAVQFVQSMGYKVISYSVLGDAGASFSAEKITKNITTSNSGDIILLHFNHPESDVCTAVSMAISLIKERGNTSFGKISEFSKQFIYE